MERREFLTASLAASALTLTNQVQPNQAQAQSASGKPREYYELRRYHLQSGPQTRLTDAYVENALIPALNRLGIAPVGAFRLDYGPETPVLYLLLPSSNLETLVTADLLLAKDAAFMKAAAPFWSAPAAAPPFQRIESSLHIAFEGWPKVTPPRKEKRIFHLRTYESPTNEDHVRKVEMFHNGEFDFFTSAGAHSVFYSDALIGSRLPSLTYMLSFADMDALKTSWAAFNANPGWKKLSSDPHYSFEPIVSNVSNLILNPTSYSQI
jgi:hypothetical protein